MDFNERLQRAVERGRRRHEDKQAEARARQMTEEELRQLHSKFRLQLSDHIEACVQKLPNFFPGFQIETIYGDRGWGAACFRDDVLFDRGKRENHYSRLEMTIRPFAEYHVVDLAGKGAIRNKEVFNRNHYEKIVDVDVDAYLELIDAWVLEYAEIYAAKQ